MVKVEQTEKTETGLDVAIVAEHGGILAWCYSIKQAENIADAMNNFWRHGDGEPRCTGCHPVTANVI